MYRGHFLLKLRMAYKIVPRHEDLLKGIYDMGFSRPSKIQERALPLMLANP